MRVSGGLRTLSLEPDNQDEVIHQLTYQRAVYAIMRVSHKTGLLHVPSIFTGFWGWWPAQGRGNLYIKTSSQTRPFLACSQPPQPNPDSEHQTPTQNDLDDGFSERALHKAETDIGDNEEFDHHHHIGQQ